MEQKAIDLVNDIVDVRMQLKTAQNEFNMIHKDNSLLLKMLWVLLEGLTKHKEDHDTRNRLTEFQYLWEKSGRAAPHQLMSEFFKNAN